MDDSVSIIKGFTSLVPCHSAKKAFDVYWYQHDFSYSASYLNHQLVQFVKLKADR
ncbi:hypothetical protein [Neobacillus endophyticus]|uniref:hypothetical protein n=1 Tax=Neobacillus endophyticus TaxID=2738405 RepID=UPI001C278218|nr:hypothetical protein [Neobacillus endophyticus]